MTVDMKEKTELDTNSLSVLLRQAIGDMDERLATGRYEPVADVWHEHDPETGSCGICLAGATFARFGVDDLTTSGPAQIGSPTPN